MIGDAAKLAGPDGKPLPGLATVAIQQARHVGRGDPRRRTRRLQAVQVLRQGGARGRRPGQGGVRGQGPPALRADRLPDVHRACTCSTSAVSAAGDSPWAMTALGSHVRRPREPGDRRRAGKRRAPNAGADARDRGELDRAISGLRRANDSPLAARHHQRPPLLLHTGDESDGVPLGDSRRRPWWRTDHPDYGRMTQPGDHADGDVEQAKRGENPPIRLASRSGRCPADVSCP